MKKFAIITVVTVIARCLLAADRPAAPAGFTWQEIPELKAAFLKPNGWFFKREKQKDTLAYFITKEDIDKNGQFQTGLSVNVFRLKNDSAVDRAKGLIGQIAEKHHADAWTRTIGSFQEFGCTIKDTDAMGTIIMNAWAVSNPKTNTLYYLTFESPESDWETAWRIGKQIMDTLALDEAT